MDTGAAGTPVIAYRHGAVPEIIDDGVTGFICDSLDLTVVALDSVPALDLTLTLSPSQAAGGAAN